MSIHKSPQPYASITHFQTHQRITWPQNEDWRLTQYAYYGEINGIPTSRGRLVATNGILCYIEQGADYATLFLGHLEHFLPDDDDGITPEKIGESARKGRTAPLSEEKLNALLDEYQ